MINILRIVTRNKTMFVSLPHNTTTASRTCKVVSQIDLGISIQKIKITS